MNQVGAVDGDIHPARMPWVEVLFGRYGVDWKFLDAAPISKIDAGRSLSNQVRDQALTASVVDNYAYCMQQGEVFTAIVGHMLTTGAIVLDDGNHRFEAAKRSRLKTFPMYVISADTRTIEVLRTEFNAKNGVPFTDAEKLRRAVHLMDVGEMTQNEAATRAGIDLTKLKKYWEKVRSDRRASSIGDLTWERRSWNKLPSTTRTRMGHLRTNYAFKELTRIANETAMTFDEVNVLVTELNTMRSEDDQKDRLVALDHSLASRRRATLAGADARVRNNPRIQLERTLQYLGKLKSPQVDEIRKLCSPEDIRLLVKRMAQAQRHLGAISSRLGRDA